MGAVTFTDIDLLREEMALALNSSAPSGWYVCVYVIFDSLTNPSRHLNVEDTISCEIRSAFCKSQNSTLVILNAHSRKAIFIFQFAN